MNRKSLLFVGLACLFASTQAFAQGRSSGGGGSAFGGGGSGGGGSGRGGGGGSGTSGFDISSGFGSQSFGDTSSFGQSSGMSALSSGMSGSATGLGRSSTSSNGGSRTRTNASGQTSRTGVRSNSQNRSSVAGGSGQRSPGRTGGGMGGLGQLGGMNGMGRGGIASRRGIGVQQLVRPQIVVNMDRAPSLAPILIAQAAADTFNQAGSLGGFKGVNVNVNEAGVATLSGSAVTARDRTIAHAMLAMQPGVRSVQNQMTVSPPANLPPIAQPTPSP